MTSFKTLEILIYKLKKEEIKSLINFLRYQQKETKDTKLKSVQLLELLLFSNKKYSANELQTILYSQANYQAFNKLVNRLKDKIYEILLFDSSLKNSNNYNIRNRTIFEVKKRLLQSEIMYLRGMNEELVNYLNKIISTAKKYEMYDCVIEALQAKQKYLGFRLGSTSYQKLKDQINFYETSRNAFNRALDIFNNLATKINFSSSRSEYVKDLELAIEVLKNDFDLTKSASIGYYYYFFLVDYYQGKSDYLTAGRILNQSMKLLENNVSINTKSRFGGTLLNIANNELLMFNLENCITTSKETINFFSDSIVNINIAKELEFFALLYQNDIKNAELLINDLYHSSRTLNAPFLYSKRAYLLASIKTLKGEILNSNNLLLEVNEIEKDKEGWNIGKRILTIINRIELGEFESVELHVQNLQRHIKRTLKTKHVSVRNVIILRILLKLINEQFDFKRVYLSRQRYFNLLESSNAEYRWVIKSPELIIFHEWFRSKVEVIPYNHSDAILKEKRKRAPSVTL